MGQGRQLTWQAGLIETRLNVWHPDARALQAFAKPIGLPELETQAAGRTVEVRLFAFPEGENSSLFGVQPAATAAGQRRDNGAVALLRIGYRPVSGPS